MRAPTSSFDLEQLTAMLGMMAAWREDLQARMVRGQLILETIGLSTDHDALIREARAFLQVCRVLVDRIPDSLVQSKAREAV